MTERIREAFEALQVSLPEGISGRFERALEPHLGQVEWALGECQRFMEEYERLVREDGLHQESALLMAQQSDLLRFHLVEWVALLESLCAMAEYVAMSESGERTVEMRRKQAEAWVQPFRYLHRLLSEYGAWLNRVLWTFCGMARQVDPRAVLAGGVILAMLATMGATSRALAIRRPPALPDAARSILAATAGRTNQTRRPRAT